MQRSHYVVLRQPNGHIQKRRMKQWLRDHPALLPKGMDADENTSQELRHALRRAGWTLEEREDEVLLSPPSDVGSAIPVETGEESGDSDLEDEQEEPEITFELERDLQAALRANIEQIEAGLTIIDGGKERTTDAGRVDITARDKSGNVVVIELKAGTASPQTVAQVLAYMGAIAEEEHKPVRGILVAGDFHQRVIFAARAVPNLELRKYTFRFTFEPVT